MKPRIHSGADRGHRLRLGEDFRIRPDSDLQILAPGALLDQYFFQPHRLCGARLQLSQIVTDEPGHLGADRAGGVHVAAGTLLDHAFQHGDGEGHPGRLDRLQVDGGEQPRAPGVARLNRRVREQGVNPADRLALCGA